MSTTTELAATEAIKRGYRTLREAVFTVLAAEGTAKDSIEVSQALARIDALLPIMEALTGRTDKQINQSVINRLRKDGRL